MQVLRKSDLIQREYIVNTLKITPFTQLMLHSEKRTNFAAQYIIYLIYLKLLFHTSPPWTIKGKLRTARNKRERKITDAVKRGNIGIRFRICFRVCLVIRCGVYCLRICIKISLTTRYPTYQADTLTLSLSLSICGGFKSVMLNSRFFSCSFFSTNYENHPQQC